MTRTLSERRGLESGMFERRCKIEEGVEEEDGGGLNRL